MNYRTALLACTVLSLTSGQTPSPSGALTIEIDRARAGLESAAPDGERAAAIARLERAKANLDAGRLYLAAYLAEAGWESARTWTLIKTAGDVTTMDAFLRQWTALGEPRALAPPPNAPVPALVAALAAVAEARGPTTYHASKPYAQDAGVAAGLYYLGESHSVMAFAAMLRTLAWPTAGPPPTVRSLAKEIADLDTEMTTAYEKMERANHPTYITASAALKQARTLNERGQFDGALFEYLLTRYLFAPLRGTSADPTPQAIAASRAALPAGTDHSIADLFLQLADEGLAGTVPAQRRGAAVVVDDIIPAYLAAIAPRSTTTTPTDAAEVTVTLVRWPFT